MYFSKRTRFNEIAEVAFIPCLVEIREAALDEDLWWKTEDFLTFKKDATQEVSAYMRINNISSTKVAINELYLQFKIMEN